MCIPTKKTQSFYQKTKCISWRNLNRKAVCGLHQPLIIPTVPHTLDCFNTAATPYSNGNSEFYLFPSDTVNPLFVIGVFSYIYKVCNPYDDTTFIVNAEGLREYLNFSRGGKSKDIRQDLYHLASERCYIHGQAYPLAEVSTEGRLTIIRSDYFHLLAVAMREYAIRPDSTEGSRYTSLVYADICKVKNKPSAEVCIELCKLVERRGSYDTTPAHISIKTMVARCPSLRQAINTATTNSRRNKILRYALSTGVELLAPYTTITAEYADFSVSLPDKISLLDGGEIITITHKGKIIRK